MGVLASYFLASLVGIVIGVLVGRWSCSQRRVSLKLARAIWDSAGSAVEAARDEARRVVAAAAEINAELQNDKHLDNLKLLRLWDSADAYLKAFPVPAVADGDVSSRAAIQEHLSALRETRALRDRTRALLEARLSGMDEGLVEPHEAAERAAEDFDPIVSAL